MIMTFGEFWNKFITQKKLVVKETSLCAYALIWEKHLKDAFSDVEIESVKNSTVQNYINESLLNGRNLKTLQDEVTLLKNIMKNYAIAEDKPYIAPLVVYPSKSKAGGEKHREKFTDAEIKKLVDYCRESPVHWHKAVALTCLTGARIGEVCGLQFGDFDFSTNTIHIQRTVGRLYLAPKSSRLYVNPTKTVSSNRIVPIPRWIAQYYKKFQELFSYSDEDYITCSSKMSFVEPRTLRSKFIKLCKDLGIEYKSYHSLRHSYASRLLLAGVDVRTAAELLGHSDVAMTLNVYSHSDESKKMAAAKKIFV